MTTKEQVTQRDREAADSEADAIYLANSDVLCEADIASIRRNLTLAFARHRRETLEEAERAVVGTNADQQPSASAAYMVCVQAIRNLK